MQVFNVQGMTCGHCVRAVTNAIKGEDPAAEVQVDLEKGEVKVRASWRPNTLSASLLRKVTAQKWLERVSQSIL